MKLKDFLFRQNKAYTQPRSQGTHFQENQGAWAWESLKFVVKHTKLDFNAYDVWRLLAVDGPYL